ncbi:UNVERIFIED_CONTAM: hypothetical protein FKN15_002855 [Acipenser sinensis]
MAGLLGHKVDNGITEERWRGGIRWREKRADPAGQASSELRADICWAGLCPPEAGSSLTSALEFLGAEEEASSVVGSADAR